MGKNKLEVAFAKGRASGAVWIDTAENPELPTDAISPLPATAVSLGFIGPDGIENVTDVTEDEYEDMDGQVIATTVTSSKETVSFVLTQTSVEVLEAIYGADNVKVTGDSIDVKNRASELPHRAWYIELVLTGGKVKRKVVAEAKPKGGRTVSYKKGEPITYPVELTCFPDEDGVTSVDFIAKAEIDDDTPSEPPQG